MATIPTAAGTASTRVATSRLTIHTLAPGREGGTPGLFEHGNASFSTF